MKKVNQFGNTTIYIWDMGAKCINIEIERIKDRKGTLLRVQTSITNDFECYSMAEVKDRIINAFHKIK